jgi:hypothetical protein
MKAHWGLELWLYSFLSSAVDRGVLLDSLSDRGNLGKILKDTHRIGSSLGHRICLLWSRERSLAPAGNRTTII